MEVLGDADFVLIRKHGFVSLGTTMKEAGERAIETHRLVSRLLKQRHNTFVPACAETGI